MLCESWLTHCTGSVCSVRSSSTAMPQTKMTTLAIASGIANAARNAAEEHDELPERAFAEVLAGGGGAVLADAEDRERQDDRAEADHGDADREQQPEVADHRDLGEAQGGEREDRIEGHDEQRGPEVPRCLLDRVLAAVEDRFLLDARVHLDRVVDADAEHHREARDRDDRERDAEVAGEAERPHDADEDHEQRQQAPPHVEQHEQDHDHDRDRDAAEREHPAAQVVVDVLQQAPARRW